MAASKTVQRIYTDGACSGNPGPGGWGVVAYLNDGSVQELGGAETQTTNNRMELQGAIAALKFLLESGQTEPATIYTDSEYVKNGITQWIAGWKRKGWKTSAGKAVLNQDLWETLDELKQRLEKQLSSPISWKYVKGHSGDRGNDRCDEIARAFAIGKIPALASTPLPVAKVAIKATEIDGDYVSPSHSESDSSFATNITDAVVSEALQSSDKIAESSDLDSAMVDSSSHQISEVSDLPREVRVLQLRHMVETLHMADEVAKQGYLITSSELADLMDVNASAVTSRGDNWVWRNWVVSRVRREGNQILWQLERVD